MTPTSSASVGSALAGAAGADPASSSPPPTWWPIAVTIVGVALVVALAFAAFSASRVKRGAPSALKGRRADADASSGDGGRAADTTSPIFAAGAQADRARRTSFAPRAAGEGAAASVAISAAAAAPVTVTSWTRCTRAATGETYFYCAATRETVWALPLGGVIVAEMRQ